MTTADEVDSVEQLTQANIVVLNLMNYLLMPCVPNFIRTFLFSRVPSLTPILGFCGAVSVMFDGCV